MLPFVCRLWQVACSKDMRATLLISQETEVDVLVKSPEIKCSVIPANPGSGPGQAPESSPFD
jgi:hypothetical protein